MLHANFLSSPDLASVSEARIVLVCPAFEWVQSGEPLVQPANMVQGKDWHSHVQYLGLFMCLLVSCTKQAC